MAGAVAAAAFTGCATTTTSNTARTGSEQLLISSAIDRSLSNVRFEDFAGYSVFIDPQYLDGTVDKGYLVGTLRARVLQGGGKLVAAADAADLVLEPRSGGVGTDLEESYVGIPALGVPGLPIEIPEVKFLSRNTQMGTAKIGLVCYDAKTGESLGSGGNSSALSHNKDTYVLGIGPFRSGSVVETREKSVGFDGIGGSLMGSANVLARHRPVQVVDRAHEPEVPQYTPVPQVATLPADSLSR
tara:strand:- start:22423 stop:23151 length:729 start_codon:yes stop_codon:yes gene_type:complete